VEVSSKARGLVLDRADQIGEVSSSKKQGSTLPDVLSIIADLLVR
jgi:hypothetical protein